MELLQNFQGEDFEFLVYFCDGGDHQNAVALNVAVQTSSIFTRRSTQRNSFRMLLIEPTLKLTSSGFGPDPVRPLVGGSSRGTARGELHCRLFVSRFDHISPISPLTSLDQRSRPTRSDHARGGQHGGRPAAFQILKKVRGQRRPGQRRYPEDSAGGGTFFKVSIWRPGAL